MKTIIAMMLMLACCALMAYPPEVEGQTQAALMRTNISHKQLKPAVAVGALDVLFAVAKETTEDNIDTLWQRIKDKAMELKFVVPETADTSRLGQKSHKMVGGMRGSEVGRFLEGLYLKTGVDKALEAKDSKAAKAALDSFIKGLGTVRDDLAKMDK